MTASAGAERPTLTGWRAGLWIGLLAIAVAGFVFDLDGSSIWDANEAFYVETPREMLESGDYVNPSFNYEPRFNKPVLSYWLVAVLYQLFGVSVAVQRAAIAGGALAMIVAAWFLARAASAHPAAPVLAALGLAANPRFFMFARRILIDVVLAAAMTLVLLFFALSERDPRRRRTWLVLMYVCVGLGVLAKGPVAAVLPAMVFAVYLFANGEARRFREMMIPSGTLIALAVAAPWYVALYVEGGWQHISGFFVGENIERYTSMFGPEGRGIFFYLPVVFSDALPWSACLPAVVAAWLWERRAPPSAERRIRTLLLLWVAVIVGFFSFSQTKQDLYIFPIVPAIAVLGSDFVARAVTGGTPGLRGWVRATLTVLALALAAAGIAGVYVLGRSEAVFPLAGVGVAAALAIGGGAAVAALAVLGRLSAATAVLLAVFIAFNWTMVLRILPSFEMYKPVVPLSAAIERHARAGDRIVQYDAALPSMVFYLRRHVDILFDEEPFMQAMRGPVPALAVLPEARYAELREAIGVRTCVLARSPLADVKLRDLLERRPPSQLVLVSTRCT